MKAADAEIARRCRNLGVREEFRPELALHWYRRGENGLKDRRAELRKVAQTRIAAMATQAHAEIDARVLKAYDLLLRGSLETDAARQFLEELPAAEALMPRLDITELNRLQLADPRPW